MPAAKTFIRGAATFGMGWLIYRGMLSTGCEDGALAMSTAVLGAPLFTTDRLVDKLDDHRAKVTSKVRRPK